MAKKRKKKQKINLERGLEKLARQGTVSTEKLRSFVDKVLEHILNGTLDEQVSKFESVAAELVVSARNKRLHHLFRMLLFGRLAERIIEEENFMLFLKIYTRSPADAHAFAFMNNGQGWINPGQAERIAVGRSIFLVRFFEIVGSKKENSINFALFVLECVAGWEERSADQQSEIDSSDGSTWAICLLLFLSFGEEPSAYAAERRWFVRLVLSWQDDPSVKDILDCILRVVESHISMLGGQSLMIRVCEDSSDDTQTAEQQPQQMEGLHYERELAGHMLSKSELFCESPHEVARTASIRLSTSEYEVYKKWDAQKDAAYETVVREDERVLRWFVDNRLALDRCLDEKREQIRHSARYGLRANGADHIDIHIAPLRNAGIRSVVFYPDGCDFPDTRLSLNVRGATPHLFSITDLAIRDLKLVLSKGFRFAGVDEGCRTESNMVPLLEYVIIDILHRIMVAEKKLRTRQRKMVTGQPDQVIELAQRAVQVRPHFMRLRPGHRASEEAAEQARKEMGWKKLPPGVTFVRAHHRGDGFAYEFPTEPVAFYTEDDLLDTGVST